MIVSDSITLRAFVNIQNLISATPGVISTLGEISPMSLTYSTAKAIYENSNLPGYRLISLSSMDNVTNQSVPVPQSIYDLTIALVDQCIAYSATNLMPYSLVNLVDVLVAFTNNSISNLTIGNIITQPGGPSIPEYLSFTNVADGSIIKVWTCDTSLQVQYDLFSIVIVPPMTPIDNFALSPTTVQTDLNAVSLNQFIGNIDAAKNNNPETTLEVYTFNYISPMAGQPPIPTNWGAIVYGPEGDNIDSIKDAIMAYIVANTTLPVSAWQSMFPSIYQRTEFIILPRWDVQSVPDNSTIAGLYRSMTSITTDISFVLNKIPFYPASFILSPNNIYVTTHYYKYITLLIVNGNNNSAGFTNIETLFPDYIPESSNSLDFNRMTTNTQGWVNLIEQMLITAETMTAFSPIPSNMRRIYRNGVLFLTAMYDNVDYLMGVKSTYGPDNPAIFGELGYTLTVA